jgi:dissimilatory sulfite reductase alpha subunit
MGAPGQEKLWDKEEKEHRKYDDVRIFTDEQLKNYTEEELKNFKAKHPSPLLDELEKGPWPSFVSDIKREALHRHKIGQDDLMIPADICDDLLGIVELSYKEGETHWKHGGIVGVLGYGGGIVGRYNDQQATFPNIAHFHTIRVNQPGAKFYTTDWLRTFCDIAEYRGSGLTNLHGSTGDLVILGSFSDQLEPVFFDLTHDLGNDIGGSGGNLRTPSDCIGKARCEFACYDTMDLCYELTMEFQDELHRPAFPYKFKFKFDGCPNGCTASIARSDMAYIGTWKDDIRINNDAVQEYVAGKIPVDGGGFAGRDWGKFDIQSEIIDLCPTRCMRWDGKKLSINNPECNRCMHCIDAMPEALRVGKDQGVSILFGAKAPILEGAQMGCLTIPFMYVNKPYDSQKNLVRKVFDWWIEEGKNRERIGETIQRVTLKTFCEVLGIPPMPQMVKEPRSNPYVFFKESEVPGGWDRDINDYRSRHPR